MKALVGYFIRHRTAPNLAMIIGAGLGLLALMFLNVQLWPTYTSNWISVSVNWQGASPGSVDRAVAQPLNMVLKTLETAEEVRTSSYTGNTTTWIKFRQGTDMTSALGQVNALVASISSFPSGIDQPLVKADQPTEAVARLLVSGPLTLESKLALSAELVERFQNAGVANVKIRGVDVPRLFVNVDPIKARSLGIKLSDVSAALGQALRAMPTGEIDQAGDKQTTRMLASHSLETIENIYVQAAGAPVPLSAISGIVRETPDRSVETVFPGGEGFFLDFQRNQDENTLKIAEIIRSTLEDLRRELPPTITLQLYDVRADQIRDRIRVLVENGIAGMALVAITLFLFLNARAAFWVLIGIPTTLALSFGLMWLTGQTINMVSVFTMVMILGILVDDAIVVAENITTRQRFDPTYAGTVDGAMQVFRPVLTSTLTTIAAFLPIFYLTDSLGTYVKAIPGFVTVALVASTVECYFLLPGHLRPSALQNDNPLQRATPSLAARMRTRLWFAIGRRMMLAFRKFVGASYRMRYISLFFVILFVGLGAFLSLSNAVRFQFWLNPESNFLYANFTLVPGSGRDDARETIDALSAGLAKVEADLGYEPGALIKTNFGLAGQHYTYGRQEISETKGALLVELADNDGYRLPASQFITRWYEIQGEIAGVESLEISSFRSGPQGADVHVDIRGDDADRLQLAINDLEASLRAMSGVSGVRNSLNQGSQELQFSLLPRGEQIGFTSRKVGQTLYAALFGERVDQIARDGYSVDVYTRFDTHNGDVQNTLSSIDFTNNEGLRQNFFDIAEVEVGRGEPVLVRQDGKLVAAAQADVDPEKLDAAAVWRELDTKILPAIAARYGVEFKFKGKKKENDQALGEIRIVLLIGLIAIYLIIAWSLESYALPIAIMLVLPLGASGALIGHFLLQYKATILSLVALVALFGVLVNDSIILIEEIRHQRAKGLSLEKAAINGYSARLRAVLLTSLTTVAGLMPLILEPGYEAQFLIPIAITITFGLIGSTILSFLLIPATIAIGDDLVALWKGPAR